MAKENTNKKKKNKVAEATGNNEKRSNKTNQSKRKKTSQNQTKNNKSTKTAKKNLTNTKNNKKKAKPSKESLAAQKQIDKIFSKNSELVKLIKIVAIVTVVMGVFYIITLIATNQTATSSEESDETSTETTATEIQYDYIMIGTMLNKKGTYYVLIEEDEDLRLSEYDTLIEMASANEDGPTIYRANLTDSFNKGYLSKEANYDSDDISDFRVTGTTLVKVVDGSIDTVYDTYDEIEEKLSELAE